MSDTPVRAPWSRSERAIPRLVLRPLQAFIDAETSGGVALLVATVAALAWVNGPWGRSYDVVWETVAGVRVAGWTVALSLRNWIGEGLMSVFFLVVALEIKRELTTGELRDRRTAVLPVVAAIGGMLVPAAIFLAVERGHAGASGWGIAMPTDIAFALGALALTAPPSLKVLLLGLAIVDDLGSIVVVALFYSDAIDIRSVAEAVVIGAGVVAMQRVHVRAVGVYLVLGVLMWLALHGSGVSPTLAGVALGLLTPSVAYERPRLVSAEAHRIADETDDEPPTPDADAAEWLHLASLSTQAISPLARLENLLRPWAIFVVVPLFALANAGVIVSTATVRLVLHSRLAWGLVAARVIGKTAGISLAIAGAVRAGVGRLPSGVRPSHVAGMAAAAGIPFTVSIFIAQLSLRPRLLRLAELSVLVAGVVSVLLALAISRLAGRARSPGAGAAARP